MKYSEGVDLERIFFYNVKSIMTCLMNSFEVLIYRIIRSLSA